MERSHLPSIKYTFQLCEKFSLHLIPKYWSSCYQKNIPFLSCKVQYTPRNWLLRRLHTEITPEVLAISGMSLENFGLSCSCEVHVCSRARVEMRHLTLVYIPNRQCSSATIYLPELFTQALSEPWLAQHQVFYTHRYSAQALIYNSVSETP